MASVFLSYARSDAARARQLARALERAGHDVWWDKRIKGGARYSKEIQSALNRADAVLVLWSSASVESAWVQDEAAAGRDSGRLVPVAIEVVEAPLGFRQYQTIDLSRWSGRGSPAALLEAIEGAAPGTKEAPSAAASPPVAKPVWQRRPAMIAIASLAALLVLFGAWYVAPKRFLGSTETPTLAVLPFTDLSPEGDKAYFSEGVGEAILTLLSREPGIKVIGRSSAAQFRPGEADFREIRKGLGATHILEGSARTAGEDLRMSVRLIDARDGAQIWAEDYQRRLSNIFAVQDEIGRAVTERLKGTLVRGTGTVRQQTTGADIYTLYLAMRAKMHTRDPQQLREALDLARNINAADPAYAPAHAARAELLMLHSVESYGSLPRHTAFGRALPHARRAVELAPDGSEGQAALGLVLSYRDPAASIAPLTRAIDLDPSRAELRLWRARSNLRLGRDKEALEDFRRVVEIEPLWGTGQINLVAPLATAGRHSEAAALIRQFEERGGSPAIAAWARGSNSYLQGDLSESVRNMLDARRLGLTLPQIEEYLAWALQLAALDSAAEQMSGRQPLHTRLFVSGRRPTLLSEIAKAGPELWEVSDADVPIQALASARDWKRLTSLYARRPAFYSVCPDLAGGAIGSRRRGSGSIAVNVAQALIATGKQEEGNRLLACVEDRLARLATPRIRESGFSDSMIAFTRAQILALRGRPTESVRWLEQAVDQGWLVLYSGKLRDYPAFDSLPAQELARIQTKLDRHLARERAEIQRFCPNCR